MAKTKTSIKKGQILNPRGAPHAWETFGAKLRKYNILSVKELYALELENIPAKDVIVINQIKKAIEEGSMSSIAWISEREDGKVKEQIETTDMTAPKKIVIEVVKSKK